MTDTATLTGNDPSLGLDDNAASALTPSTKAPARKRRTKRLMIGMIALATVGAVGWYGLTLGTEWTDDAQVEGRVVSIAARVPGQVRSVRVEDNQVVAAGDVLFDLDTADYAAKVDAARADVTAAKAAVDGAAATLALTEKTAPASLTQAKGGFATANAAFTSAQATIAQANADLVSAKARANLAKLNVQRARRLSSQHAVAAAEVDVAETDERHANAVVAEARARLDGAKAARTASRGGILLAQGRLIASDTSAEQVAAAQAALSMAKARQQQAEAALKMAELNLSYTTARAPRSGTVSKRNVEVGQMVSPERPLISIVESSAFWIIANFKEDQLAAMREGQPAVVRLDTYKRREFAGKVVSIARGTGSRFALLPPDNATGNFIKVVQRIPVLIRLERADVELRPGMSAEVSVRTRP